jgi:Na+-driven multidrug efflux pump
LLSNGSGPAPAAHPNIFRFWYPLAAQWLMMSLEGPYLAAIIARTADPAFNLAAHGIAHAFAILVESPVIMLMSAATALVENAASYRRLRAFANALNVGATVLMVIVLIPPVHQALMGGLLGLPPQVTELVYGALWLLLPWPAAIGYRRFLHGLLIRSGRTRLVAMGTIFRLVGMTSTALILFSTTDLPGAWVGASALSASVVIEALVTRLLASGVLRELLAEPAHRAIAHAPPEKEAAAVAGVPTEEAEALPGVIATPHPSATDAPSYGEIARFYYPLALTSFIGLSVQPMLTFFMGRAAQPIGSLAVYPVVHALAFLFRAVGFSFQEVVIALSGRRREHVAALRRFGIGLAVASSGALALVVFTPLVHVWFRSVSGLTPDLAALAIAPARISVVLPAMAVLVAFQHGLLVQGRRTRPITIGTLIELVGIGVLFVIFGWNLGLTGVTAALLALVGGRLAGNLYLRRDVKRTVEARG